MALRIEKTACCLIVLAASVFAAEPLRYQARHDHWRKFCSGELVISDEGLSYRGKHTFSWAYADIQRFELSQKRVRVLTYKDDRLKLGADVEEQFTLVSGDFAAAYALLKDQLDERLVAALADPEVKPLWQVPVKLEARLRGSEGILKVSQDRVVYETALPGDSRTWRYSDIETVSSSGPFELTITTLERRDFHFQLKARLPSERYDDLWRRTNLQRGLPVLTPLAP